MIRRRFVNLVANNFSSGERSLHRLDAAKHLFYPSTAKAEAANAKEAEKKSNAKEAHAVAEENSNGVRTPPPRIGSLRRLPPPTMNLATFPTSDRHLLDDKFVRLYDGRILHTNSDKGLTHLYDAGAGSTTAIPTLQRRKGTPILIPISGTGDEEEEKEERIYVMSNYCCDRSFEVLDFSQHPHKWEPLSLPPFAESPGSNIRSFTVVDGGSTICVSVIGRDDGTYCFDTRSHEWRKAGDWALPFDGRAEHVPELDTWFGIQLPRSNRLCASSDLSAAATAAHREPSTLQHSLEYLDLAYESEYIKLKGRLRGVVLCRSRYWSASIVGLLSLGGGRLCIATVIHDDRTVSLECESHTTTEAEFLVLSGVEVVRGGDDEEKGGLRMVKHKSKRYMFDRSKIRWVL